MSQGVLDRAATVADLQRALREVPQSPGPRPGIGLGSVESAIVVLGAQPNVETSTLAAALADALASGLELRLDEDEAAVAVAQAF